MKLMHYHEELQKAIDKCLQYHSKYRVAQMSETDIQWEYGRILAAERRKADQEEYVEMLNELDRYVTEQYKESNNYE